VIKLLSSKGILAFVNPFLCLKVSLIREPAKMDAQLLIRIVETYTKPGETILDQMAGSGTTMLACMLGRNVVLVELEERFVKMCQDNWEKVKMHHQLGYEMGTCQIIQGDARQLENILCDSIVTSPPYAGGEQFHDLVWIEKERKRPHNPQQKQNMSNLPYGQIDSIIPSLPCGEPCKVDNIVTSPPYEGAMDGGSRHTKGGIPERDKAMKRIGSYDTINKANIGNLYKDSYLSAMKRVYEQCQKVLKPGGLMVLVVKPFVRNRKVVHLEEDTKRLCESVGFTFVEEHHRQLTAMSFWRTIYYAKNPEVEKVDKEYILVFKKNIANTFGRIAKWIK